MNRIKHVSYSRKIVTVLVCILVFFYFFSGFTKSSFRTITSSDPYVLTQDELFAKFDPEARTPKPSQAEPSHWDEFDIWHIKNRGLLDSLESPLYKSGNFLKEFVYEKAPYYNERIEDWRKRYENTKIKKDTIFVLLPAFRDPECNVTLSRIFTRCKNCDNVFVGLVHQIKVEEDAGISCYGNLEYSKKNVRVVHVPSHQAEGPTHARFLGSKLWDGEEYMLSIDAHTKLLDDWDEKLLYDYNNLKFPSEIVKNQWVSNPTRHLFSTYPRIYSEKLEEIENDEVPFICHVVQFHDNGLITQRATAHYSKEAHNGYPLPGSLVGAGFIFGNSHWLYDAPFDRYTPYVFHGEEMYLALRLWTRGWNIFVAPRNYVTHLYGGKKNTFWNAAGQPYFEKQKLSIKRILYGLNLTTNYPEGNDIDMEYYRLGTKRSLEDWKKFSGIYPVEKMYTPRCGQYYDYVAGKYAGKSSEKVNETGK